MIASSTNKLDELDSGATVVEFFHKTPMRHLYERPSMTAYCDTYITVVFFWWFSHVIVGSQRIFLALTIISAFFMNVDNLNHNVYPEKPHNNNTTISGIFQCKGLVSNHEKRNSAGVILYRNVKSPMGHSLYFDKNGDGHWDQIELHKKYAGVFRIPDSEFDRYFAERWRYGTMVKLEDRDGDGCFKKKTLSEIRSSREDVWTTVFTDKNCDGIYEIQEERNIGWPPDSLYDRIWTFGRELILSPVSCL